jgi:hypothetical protein
MTPVLITGARAPAALDLARSFRAAGYAPHLADCSPCRTARISKVPRGVHAYASPVSAPERFARDIDELVRSLDPVMVIPVCEEVFHLAALARRRPVLAERLFAPPFDILRALHSKRLFARGCIERGLLVPQTWPVRERGDLGPLPPGDALVLKPEYSRFGVGAAIRPSPAALAALPIGDGRAWVAQSYVQGTEVSFYAVARCGSLAAFGAYGSAWRERGGASYAFAPLDAPLAAPLRDIAATLADWVGDGQFACDVIVDDRGQPWLLECNPRATSGVHLFRRDAALAQAFTGAARRVEPQDEGLLYVAPAFWLLGLSAALRDGKLMDWRRDRRRGRDVIGADGDGAPRVGALADAAAFAISALAARHSLAEAMTADIEWNGETT